MDVLIIDDQEGLAQVLNLKLRAKGLQVELAFTAEAGLEKCREFKPGTVLCDYNLPDMQGIQLIRAIKKDLPDCRLFLITGYSQEDKALKKVANSIEAVFYKPFDFNRIFSEILKPGKVQGGYS